MKLFEAGTLQRLSELKLGPSCYTEDITHQAENASFNVEYAYVATNALDSFSGGESKEQIPNTFKEAMTLPQAARWKLASDKEIASLEKHGVYELVPITSVPNGRKVVGTRWVYNIKADGIYKGPTGRARMVTSPRDRLWWHLCPRGQAPEHPNGTCNRRGAGLRGLHAGRANSISQHLRRGESFLSKWPPATSATTSPEFHSS